ncbi:hypothetical protein VTI74DRAFT_5561 [Chaetomium olivicolor]
MAEPTLIPSLSALDALTSTHKYLILDFTAQWCPPCKAIAPLFGKLAREFSVPNVLGFGKVDVDEAPDVASKFGVTAMPTFVFLVDGEAKGVDVSKGQGIGGGGVVLLNEEGHGEGKKVVGMIRGADARNLVAVVAEVGRLAKEEAGEPKGEDKEEKKEEAA